MLLGKNISLKIINQFFYKDKLLQNRRYFTPITS